MSSSERVWNARQKNREQRLARATAALGSQLQGKIAPADQLGELLYAVLENGDRVCVEGNNQKQADFLAKGLAALDPARVNGLHMLFSVLALPEHLDVFEKGIADRLDFSFSGPQAGRLAKLASAGKLNIGAIHTYLELFGRYFVDLTPRVALVAAQAADRHGNLYTGPNTEDTPAIAEATAFSSGIVIAQVNEIVDELPRVDIPADWVSFAIKAPTPHYIEPLFTRDPAQISEIQVLMAMMAIKGIYAEYGVQRLNHGIGFDTAAIELILPTYAESLGLRGKICKHWALNPHPALIPAIEAGFVESVHSFGSELGMEDYIRARPDVFFVGPDGSMRSNRAFSQTAGHYGCDMFIGSTLQIDLQGNSSTATLGRIAGFGGAPNMGADARGRRHASEAWLKAGQQARAGRNTIPRGQKLVVQTVETFREHMQPAFVEKLDAWQLGEQAKMPIPPVMIYGDDVTHILTEEGIANLLLCRTEEEREQAIRGVAGYTAVGMGRDKRMVENLRDRGIIRRAEDLGIDKRMATRDLLAAKNMKDLVRASGGLYNPPKRFRNW
ncbi:malonate decarboxylase subunit alpha [Herbaspirillum rubrisubalbicans]|jgi:malonate decarboxylase alpha subunit|uniref:Malonate decarboxylase subunit alpha n=1 Tax=Herbaspirillum rubrisubalbicans TaxID=80842 RepID=A0AAD0UAT4_9BURK|nr:malonate decarboxylase subunit alpha [Herbaspirillum rubrisubalbicans]ALU89946.1 malonate decarboxylase alpha subunit protein [Herbaspirillum rubrisubalbicans M1]AYR25017.1 malonate decarboxylase subunit alpha [Herbaspirillum rubrisubalbicans]MCP1573088.1 malonate decarboxylase alpha subunit [Herbaspirillum rubrisubalbicans]NQE47431.1 malonate decarboxylase subunit alpha [Herbaspirillum rubrisubalbicans]RAM63435.1 malonate decarboxylase subunit alpha [Herbaspirillum rubrisubalbicans]